MASLQNLALKPFEGTSLESVVKMTQIVFVAHGVKSVLNFDVWEHAYYLDYQILCAAHLGEHRKIVDWSVVEGSY